MGFLYHLSLMDLNTTRAHKSKMQMKSDFFFFSDCRQKFGINIKPVQYSSSGQSKLANAVFTPPRITALSLASLQLTLSPGKHSFGGTH